MQAQPEPAATGTADVLRQRLVDRLVAEGLVRDPAIEAAFRAVPRHLFVPGTALERAYADDVVVVKLEKGIPVSSSSQPAIMAVMLEQLRPRPGQRLLEIGAGSGYNAALLATIAGATGPVVTVDVDGELVEEARLHLAAAGLTDVQVICADGTDGYAAEAPYDGIIVTAAAREVFPAWWQQLKPGGRIVLPLFVRGDQLVAALRKEGEHLISESLEPCGFMPLRGPASGGPGLLWLGRGVSFASAGAERLDAEQVRAALATPGDPLPTGLGVSAQEAGHLVTWLACVEPSYCRVRAQEVMPGLPVLFARPGLFATAAGVFLERENGTLEAAFLVRPDTLPLEIPQPGEPPQTVELLVRGYGGSGSDDRLLELVHRWDSLGRPRPADLSLQVLHHAAPIAQTNASVIETPHCRLVFTQKATAPDAGPLR